MVKIKKAILTFDVDLVDYSDNSEIDELDLCFELIMKVLNKYPSVKTCWFLRIDLQLEHLYGNADYIFTKHKKKIEYLQKNGHMLGWHCHPYKMRKGKWVQQTDENAICKELKTLAPLAKMYNLKTVRMGWGYHTNTTLEQLYRLGFNADSSAIPRPVYAWETSVKDWSTTGNKPYYPSVKDYRISGKDKIGILEVPITTALIDATGDTETVKRYINPAYYNDVFKKAVLSIKDTELLITITHPYELMPNANKHNLLSFSGNQFEKNIEFLVSQNIEFINDFITLNDYGNT